MVANCQQREAHSVAIKSYVSGQWHLKYHARYRQESSFLGIQSGFCATAGNVYKNSCLKHFWRKKIRLN